MASGIMVKASPSTPSDGLLAQRFGPSAGQADLELAKWLAVAAMAIDHYGKIVEPGLYLETHAVGRVAFPLLATVIGMRLALRPSLAASYVRRLLPWAVISQPVYVLAGRDWHEGNVLLTLLLGVVATMLVRRFTERRAISALAGILMVFGLGWFVEYGVIGIAMIPITVTLAAWRPSTGLGASGPIGVAANLNPTWPLLQLVDMTAILATAIALVSVQAKMRLPRLPGHIFYGFYPAHLLGLHWLDLASQLD